MEESWQAAGITGLRNLLNSKNICGEPDLTKSLGATWMSLHILSFEEYPVTEKQSRECQMPTMGVAGTQWRSARILRQVCEHFFYWHLLTIHDNGACCVIFRHLYCTLITFAPFLVPSPLLLILLFLLTGLSIMFMSLSFCVCACACACVLIPMSLIGLLTGARRRRRDYLQEHRQFNSSYTT